MLLLAIDTSTSAITVCLHDGQTPVAATVNDARGHAEQVGPLLQRCLEESGRAPQEVTDVAVGTGPGPFTGLRVGIVSGLVFAYAQRIAAHGVCSLDALAHEAALGVGDGEFLVATDARRRELYVGRYAAERGVARRLTDPAVARPATLAPELRGLPTAGRGPLLFPDLFPQPLGGPLDVGATALAEVAIQHLAQGLALPVEPLYLRRPDALTTAERAAR